MGLLNKLKHSNSAPYKNLIITAILSLSIYLASSIFIFIMSLETDYNHLRYGLLITIIYCGQLVIFFTNFMMSNDKKTLERLKIKFELKLELILRFSTFLILSINLRRFGLDIPLKYKYIIILCSFMASVYIIVNMYKKIEIAEDKVMEIERYSNNNENQDKDIGCISIFGVTIYSYSVDVIGKDFGFFFLMTKSIFFCAALVFIMKNLKGHYKTINKVNNKKYLISGSLVMGFCLSFLAAIFVQYYLKDVTKADLTGIKDVMFIVAMLFAIPLFNEYKRLGE